jgi:ribonuclease HI
MPAYAYISQRDGQYGVLTSWGDIIELRKQKKGVFVSRKFDTSDEAWTKIEHAMRPYEGGPVAFVDGAGSDDMFSAGAGVCLLMDGLGTKPTCEIAVPITSEDKSLQGQIPGEFAAATIALEKAERLGAKSLLIAYDYIGIMAIAEGLYATRSRISAIWMGAVQSAHIQGMDVRFRHVYSHEGITDNWAKGNNRADKLAKLGRSTRIGNIERIPELDGWISNQ